jgi:hypothetical protein
MVYDPIDQQVLLFGGYNAVGGAKSDTWTFSQNQWVQTSASGPAGRYAAGIAWDVPGRQAVLFGGYSGTGTYYNDTWTYQNGAWNNATGTTNHTPPARWRPSMTYDESDGYIVMFGGTNALGTALSDTWEFSKGNWTQLTVNGSAPGRYRASMTYDPIDNTTVLFGGCTTSTCADSGTWGYHHYNWTNINPTSHPSARVYYGLTYSPVARTVLLFGGSTSGTSNTPVSDTWNFTNNSWSSLTSSLTGAPTAVAYVMMAYDAIDGYTVMYGGQWANGTFSDRTWALGPTILGQIRLAPGNIDLGQSTVVNATPVAFSSYVKFQYTALPPGCSAGNVSTFTCTPNAVGTFPVNVTVNDSVGKPSNQSATLVVTADPVIGTSRWDLSAVTVGTATTLRTTASGGSGTLRYSYSNLPNGCATANVTNLTCLPTQSGTFVVHVAVADTASFVVRTNVTLLVNAKPAFGTLLTVPASIDKGQSFTLFANVSNGTGTAPFSFVYRGLPAPCATQNLSALVCTPGATGSTVITVNVTDTFGWSVQATVGVSVAADPAFSSGTAAPSAFDVGTPVTVWANASGGTGVLSYTYTGMPAGCVLGNHAANTCTPTVAGNFTVTATVTDAVGFNITETISLVVNPTMVLGPVTASPGAIDAGQNVTIVATPTGGTGPFVYAFTGLPRGCLPTTGSGTVTCAPRVAGDYTLAVTVTDASGITAPSGGSLTVHNDPNVVSFVASANSVTLHQSVDLTVVAKNGSQSYSYVYSGLPPGCVSANASVLHCTPTATGTYSVTVVVKDSLGVSATAAPANVTVASPASSSFLGLPAVVGYALLGLIVAIVVVAAVLLMRRRSSAPKEPPAKAEPERWSEENPPEG